MKTTFYLHLVELKQGEKLSDVELKQTFKNKVLLRMLEISFKYLVWKSS